MVEGGSGERKLFIYFFLKKEKDFFTTTMHLTAIAMTQFCVFSKEIACNYSHSLLCANV